MKLRHIIIFFIFMMFLTGIWSNWYENKVNTNYCDSYCREYKALTKYCSNWLPIVEREDHKTEYNYKCKKYYQFEIRKGEMLAISWAIENWVETDIEMEKRLMLDEIRNWL